MMHRFTSLNSKRSRLWFCLAVPLLSVTASLRAAPQDLPDPGNAAEALAQQKGASDGNIVNIAKKLMMFDPNGTHPATPLVLAEAAKVPQNRALQSDRIADQGSGPQARENGIKARHYWKVSVYFNELAVQAFIAQRTNGNFQTMLRSTNRKYGTKFVRDSGIPLNK